MISPKKQYFHSFDTLRFIFFLFVFLLHCPMPSEYGLDFIFIRGGVTFFFVLSGFLITYILLFEKGNFGKIDLKSFFKRRGLRIYPLFYLLIAFAYLSSFILKWLNLPSTNQGYEPNLLVSVFFLENYKMMIIDSFPDGAPLRVMWSLCVNEHFYIIWAFILAYVKQKHLPKILLIGIVVSTCCRLVYNHYNIQPIDVFSNFDYFAFGALPAYYILHKPEWITYVEKVPKYLKYGIGLCVFLIPRHLLGVFSPLLFGLLFMMVIIITLPFNNGISIGRDYWMNKLGKYTYGMYLYHTIFILFVQQLFRKLNMNLSWEFNFIASLSLTILVSMASYHWFELPFLELSKKLRKIKFSK